MLRPIACTALLLSSIVPVEQPAAFAQNWKPVADSPFCIAEDSEQYDHAWVSWAFIVCSSPNDVGHAKADCQNQPKSNEDQFTWYLSDGSGNWLEQSSSQGTREWQMVNAACIDWALMGD